MSLLNLEAFDATPLEHDPYDYLVVHSFIEPETLRALNRDFPVVNSPGNFPPSRLPHGPEFDALLDEINSPELAQRLGAKFGVDLARSSTTVTVRGFCEPSDGNIHTDHWSKMITALIYFNESWSHEGGRLRILRSRNNIDDYASEILPVNGTLLAFKRSKRSFHGHKRFEGARRIMQVSWNNPHPIARSIQQANRFSTHMMKRLLRLASSGGSSSGQHHPS